MKKSKNEIVGQLVFDWNTDTEHWVAEGNRLLEGRQYLGLNAAKIVRAVIMQIKPDDTDFKPYVIQLSALADMLHVDRTDLYRDIDRITDEITESKVEIREENSKNFSKYPWVAACHFNAGIGLAIQMNPLLKDYLIGLKANYTQYQLADILTMKSVYAIRIYELLMKERGKKFKHTLPNNGAHIVITIQEIRQACGCEQKYDRISQFKSKVLDVAVNEINRTTTYRVSYTPKKEKKKIVSIDWYINMCYHKLA